jgi:sterol desaturase/sphingolipid hydroxylase (fatty acid hydroxylase superfamily)
MWICPTDPALLTVFGLYMAAVGVRNELGYELQGRMFMRTGLHRVLGSSLFHALHHRHFDYHFGLSTSLMDWMFGTVHPRYEALLGEHIQRT